MQGNYTLKKRQDLTPKCKPNLHFLFFFNVIIKFGSAVKKEN